jgi:hypothetical protein
MLFGVAVAIVGAVALMPAFMRGSTGATFMISSVSELQRSQSLLALAMLGFVIAAMVLMRVSGASKVFGVSLGLGLMAANDLLQARLLVGGGIRYPLYNLVNAGVVCTILLLWTAYLAWPEPERREIAAGSPLLRWNRWCLERFSQTA